MIEIRPLRPDDDRADFSSGDPDLDRFFQKFAGQNQFRLHIGTSYVAISQSKILGFVTVAASSITIDKLPAKTRKGLPVPGRRICFAAADQPPAELPNGQRPYRLPLLPKDERCWLIVFGELQRPVLLANRPLETHRVK